MIQKWKKTQAGYVHFPKTQYECADCRYFLPHTNRCTLMKRDAVIQSYGSCNYFLPGSSEGRAPLGLITKEEGGYVENLAKAGYSCKRCEHFGRFDCSEVEKGSPGADPGIISPQACCNVWEPDPVRSKIPTMAFSLSQFKK